jgi:hypothetical protein
MQEGPVKIVGKEATINVTIGGRTLDVISRSTLDIAESLLTAEEELEIDRTIRSHRGRWMVVDVYGYVIRFRSKSEARGYARTEVDHGVPAVVRRWRRDLTVYHHDIVGFRYLGVPPMRRRDRIRLGL